MSGLVNIGVDVTEKLLNILEEQGFIKIKVNPETGEKELQKVKCI